MIKSHGLYDHYLSYLTYKQKLNRISVGSFNLMKISESSFTNFVYDYEHSNGFKKIIDDIRILEIRDNKINKILNATNRGSSY